MIDIYFLGTGAAIPSKEGGHSTVAVSYLGEIILFDCGEGTQRQMIIAGLSLMKISKIFVTHFHADHFAGIFSLTQSMNLLGRKNRLDIYGPEGIKEIGKHLKGLIGELEYVLEFKEAGKVEEEGYIIKKARASHGMPAYAYSFEEKKKPEFLEKKAKELGVFGLDRKRLQQGKNVRVSGKTIHPCDVLGEVKKGKKIVYSGDTVPLRSIAKLAKDADLLIHEATFADDKCKEAKEYRHSTARQAAEIAKEAGAKRLVLTHISPRYRKAEELTSQAKEVFERTEIARDLLVLRI